LNPGGAYRSRLAAVIEDGLIGLPKLGYDSVWVIPLSNETFVFCTDSVPVFGSVFDALSEAFRVSRFTE
jgi:hypothetical protein